MGTNTLTVVILYTNLQTHRYKVDSRAEVKYLIHNEGDHVMDWYIEEDMKNERLR